MKRWYLHSTFSTSIYWLSTKVKTECNKRKHSCSFRETHWANHQNGKRVPGSISDKASYRKISRSIKAARLVVWIVTSLWNSTGTSPGVLRGVCQMSESSDISKDTSVSFDTSWALTTRHLVGYWNRVHFIIDYILISVIYTTSHQQQENLPVALIRSILQYKNRLII